MCLVRIQPWRTINHPGVLFESRLRRRPDFGIDNLSATTVYNIHIIDNILVDIPGNVEGCHASRAAFGMGLYIDNYSRDVEVSGNTVISTTISGILYQRSTGRLSTTPSSMPSGTESAGKSTWAEARRV